MSDGAFIRQLGAAHRHQVAVHYHNRGDAGGRRIAKRYIEETLAEVCEAEGREAAYGLVMSVADRLVAGRMLATGNLLPGVIEPAAVVDEELLPGPKAAAARLENSQAFQVDADVRIVLAPHIGLVKAVPIIKDWLQDQEKLHLANQPRWRRILRACKPSGFLVGLVIGMWWAWRAR